MTPAKSILTAEHYTYMSLLEILLQNHGHNYGGLMCCSMKQQMQLMNQVKMGKSFILVFATNWY